MQFDSGDSAQIYYVFRYATTSILQTINYKTIYKPFFIGKFYKNNEVLLLRW